MEHFFGHDLTREELELAGLRVDPMHRENQAALMASRWFDYRHMHPVMATYFYAHCYCRQTRQFYEKFIDVRTVEEVRAFSPDDIFMSRDMTSMWLARSCADELGMPYTFVLDFAQSRFFARGQRYFPRPNQLYGEELEIDLRAAWKEQVGRQITYSNLPRFKASAWRGEPDQVEHTRFLIDQVKARQEPRHRLLARLLHEDLLSVHQVSFHFGEAQTHAASRYMSDFLVSQR